MALFMGTTEADSKQSCYINVDFYRLFWSEPHACCILLKADAGEPLLLKPWTPGPHSGNLLHHGNKTEPVAQMLCTHVGERVRTDVGKGVSVLGCEISTGLLFWSYIEFQEASNGHLSWWLCMSLVTDTLSYVVYSCGQWWLFMIFIWYWYLSVTQQWLQLIRLSKAPRSHWWHNKYNARWTIIYVHCYIAA